MSFTTVKEVLIEVRDNELKDGGEFICNRINTILWKQLITEELHKKTMRFLTENKPIPTNQFSSYTRSKYWIGEIAWWSNYGNTNLEKTYRRAINIKKKYLTDLINTL